MSSLNVLRPVTVKAKVTDGLKDRLAGELQTAIKHLDEEVQQLDFQLKRAQLTIQNLSPQQQIGLRQQVEVEKQKRAEKKQQIMNEIKAVAELKMGTEIVQGQVQSVATIALGDDWDDAFSLEVLLEDGKVIAIRRGED